MGMQNSLEYLIMLFLMVERPLLQLLVVKNEFNLKMDPEICFIYYKLNELIAKILGGNTLLNLFLIYILMWYKDI